MYLRSQPSRVPTPRCRGFTIAEMVVAIFLTALLAVLMAEAAAIFARPAAEVDGRTRLALEASLAAEALARDLSGYLADNSGVPRNLDAIPVQQLVCLFGRYDTVSQLPGDQPRTAVRPRDVPAAGLRTGSNPEQPRSECGGRQPRDRLQRLVMQSRRNPEPGWQQRNDRDHPHLSRPVEPRQGHPRFSGTYVLIGVQPPPLPTPQ